MNQIKDYLVLKFEDIQNRMLKVINQLNDEQLNWQPNESSNSIANIVVHISGNIGERISKGINNKAYTRNRNQEFEEMYVKQQALIDIVKASFAELIETTKTMTDERFMDTQLVRKTVKTNIDVLLQCTTHFSEHLGQIFYIAKMLLNTDYVTTSIPKTK